MGTEKRQRQKANKAAREAAEAAAAKRKRQLRMLRNGVILLVLIILALWWLSGCTSSDSDGATTTTTTATTDPTTTGPTSTTAAAPGEVAYGKTPCPSADGGTNPTTSFADAFEQCIDPAKTYTATFDTTEGTVVVDLNAKALPLTVNNFVALARAGYYDGTDLFRIIPSAGIIQGGSPHTQNNTDPGPGYTIPDEGPLATTQDYVAGTLAMARTSEPNSASAQFFFLANDGSSSLGDPAQPGGGTYRVFGKTTEGLDVLEKMLAAGTDTSDGPTTKQVTVKTVTITES